MVGLGQAQAVGLRSGCSRSAREQRRGRRKRWPHAARRRKPALTSAVEAAGPHQLFAAACHLHAWAWGWAAESVGPAWRSEHGRARVCGWVAECAAECRRPREPTAASYTTRERCAHSGQPCGIAMRKLPCTQARCLPGKAQRWQAGVRRSGGAAGWGRRRRWPAHGCSCWWSNARANGAEWNPKDFGSGVG